MNVFLKQQIHFSHVKNLVKFHKLAPDMKWLYQMDRVFLAVHRYIIFQVSNYQVTLNNFIEKLPLKVKTRQTKAFDLALYSKQTYLHTGNLPYMHLTRKYLKDPYFCDGIYTWAVVI